MGGLFYCELPNSTVGQYLSFHGFLINHVKLRLLNNEKDRKYLSNWSDGGR